MHPRRSVSHALRRFALLLLLALSGAPLTPALQTVHAATNTISLNVVNARSEANHPTPSGGTEIVTAGQPIPAGRHFTWMINRDNVGDPTQAAAMCRRATNPNYPQGCDWPARRAVPGNAPVVASGDERNAGSIDLPDGKYLVSVVADGYKIDGTHFSIPSDTPTIEVAAQPFPLPLATIRLQVVEDRATTNGENDIPDEAATAAHPMGGFTGHLSDILGEVTTDWFGNPLCTEYQTDANGVVYGADGKPVVLHLGAGCVSNVEGLIVIPNIGPNRYTASVIPPDGTDWVQTSTLEGNHDWDTWVQEGATGYDTERTTNGEPVPAVDFAFVCPTDPLPASGTAGAPAPVRYATDSGGTARPCASRTIPAPTVNPALGSIKGRVWANRVYVPPTGGLPYPSTGYSGAKLDQPIADAWLALTDVNNGDQLVVMVRANADGTFTIPNVPNGDYTLTVWDEAQDYLLDLFNVTVANAQVVDLGNVQLAGWWTWINGHVFVDANGNGKQDPGEQGVPNLVLTLRTRSNDVIGRGSNTVTTDASGYYEFREAYPLGSWLIVENYNDRFYTTGITYQADNQPTESTLLGAGVDVNVLNIIGLGGRIDWGVKTYDPSGVTGPKNGGIVGTVTYDATRNETNAREALTETYQPGVAGVTLKLYKPITCTAGSPNCAANPNGGAGYYLRNADGSLAHAATPLNVVVTDQWQRPKNCIARDVTGSPIDYDLLPFDKVNSECLESPMQGFQIGTFPGPDGVDFTALVDGNYAFNNGCLGAGGATDTDTCADNTAAVPLPAGDYIVTVVPPDGYQVTKEEDVNVFTGDVYTTQITPPACVGTLHTVHVVDDPALAGFDPASPGTTSGVYNPGFLGIGGSPYEGQKMPLCDAKLIKLQNGRSSAWNFNLFTPTPMPGRLFGLVTDDLNLSFNPQDLLFGEKAGTPNLPIGIYDYSNRLVTTIQTDPDGFFEVLLPSTSTYNCPLPAGPCPNVYRLVGNDPGPPGHPNANYNPAFRTISASFEVWPGQVIPADLAPTQVGVTIQGPGSLLGKPAQCAVDPAAPQLFAVDKPYGPASGTVTIKGVGFGATKGAGSVTLDGVTLATTSWSDRQIVATVSGAVGPHQLTVKADNGLRTIDGLTYHVTGVGYTPSIYEVGSGHTYAKIQDAIEAANNTPQSLVVVYPSAVGTFNPLGAYNENIIVHSAIKLQGVGPGGIYPDNTAVLGSVIDGTGFGTDQPRETDWINLLNGFTWDGNQNVYDGQVIYVLRQTGKVFGSSYKAAIDGFTIQGGDQLDFPGNITEIFGLKIPGGAGTIVTQGGGIYVNGGADNLQITNNVLRSNSGAYGGAIRLGTPSLDGAPLANSAVRIANNRIISNAGTNRAGAIGIFAGTTGYEIAGNDLCGNFSAEYGGAIGHYGLSAGGSIHDNRIYFNRSYDEGAGIMIAGELPANPSALSAGAGPVDIYDNQIQANLANDDGGGIRFLMAGSSTYNVYNNLIVNNISTHEGGGIALDDAPHVRVFNNTIMKNITTATAATSNGQPAPAGLSTGANSVQLRAADPTAGSFSNPLLFNNLFSDNRAGSWNGGTVVGIGLAGAGDVNLWDLGAADGSGLLSPTNSLLDSSASNTASTIASPTNIVGANPTIVDASYSTSVSVLAWRTNPTFVGSAIVAVDLPPNLMGNYHLQDTSPAKDSGAASASGVSAPSFDIDRDARPAFAGYDIGADEIRGLTADLSITKDDGRASVRPGDAVTYTITVTNGGPDAVNLAQVVDSVPASLTGVTWTCAATLGSSCTATSGSGSAINTTVSLLNGGVATFTVNATVSASLTAATTAVANTVAVTAPSGTADPNTLNNTATDTDAIRWADVSVTKTDLRSSVSPGSQVTYLIVARNSGPTPVSGVTVVDSVPATLTNVTWSCTAVGAGNSCPAASGTGSINGTINLQNTGALASVTFTLRGTVVASAAGGSLSNTASVALPAAYADPNPSNNIAVDTDTINASFPQTAVLDTFNRGNGGLGGNWSGSTGGYSVNSSQALVSGGGAAFWSAGGSNFGATQEAFFTLTTASSTATEQDLLLKVNGLGGGGAITNGTTMIEVSYHRVAPGSTFQGSPVPANSVTIEALRTNQRWTIHALIPGVTLAAGDRLGARALFDGTVQVFKYTAAQPANGWVQIGTVNVTQGANGWPANLASGGGRVGVWYINSTGARFDDFGGGTVN